MNFASCCSAGWGKASVASLHKFHMTWMQRDISRLTLKRKLLPLNLPVYKNLENRIFSHIWFETVKHFPEHFMKMSIQWRSNYLSGKTQCQSCCVLFLPPSCFRGRASWLFTRTLDVQRFYAAVLAMSLLEKRFLISELFFLVK